MQPRRYVIAGQQFEAPELAPGLYVVATPIGNLRDMTIRGLETLAAADVIYCEDTRTSSRLTEHFGIGTPRKALHEHNERALAEAIAAEWNGVGEELDLLGGDQLGFTVNNRDGGFASLGELLLLLADVGECFLSPEIAGAGLVALLGAGGGEFHLAEVEAAADEAFAFRERGEQLSPRPRVLSPPSRCQPVR